MTWLSKTLTAVLVASFHAGVHGLSACLAAKCVAGENYLVIDACSLTEADFDDISECYDTVGRTGITYMYLQNNDFTSLPSDLFTGMPNVRYLSLENNNLQSLDAATFQPMAAGVGSIDLSTNQLTSLPSGLFAGMATLFNMVLDDNQLETLPGGIFEDLGLLKYLRIRDNELTTLDVDTFTGLAIADFVDLGNNELTTLPDGVFESIGSGSSLRFLVVSGNEGLQCIPTNYASGYRTSSSYSSTNTYSDEVVTAGLCECTGVATCDAGYTCTDGAAGYTCDAATVTPACDDGTSLCGDPHMQGLRGQKIDWSGVDGGWYSMVTDEDANIHVNVRLTAPLPQEFPDRQLITGVSIMSEGHSLIIEVANPYSVDTNGCPPGISPCLSNGGLRAIVDGEEVVDLLQFSRNEYVADGISMSASNLPAECRSFGGDKIWVRLYDEMLQGRRELTVEERFEDWILGFGHMTASDWCTTYVEQHDLADVQSVHAVFKIVTSSVTVRINAGTNYQDEGELDSDGRVLPDLEFWQMDVGLEGLSLENKLLSGILGETARPVLDGDGHEIMQGYDAFRGSVEDYQVSSAVDIDFALLHMK